MTVLNNTDSASTTHQRIHAFAMNGASMNWACLSRRYVVSSLHFKASLVLEPAMTAKNVNQAFLKAVYLGSVLHLIDFVAQGRLNIMMVV